jgi:hypothetical protein
MRQRGVFIRRLRCATPPVMHISPHAGLRTDIFKLFYDADGKHQVRLQVFLCVYRAVLTNLITSLFIRFTKETF